jgi:hypothetical protein
MRGLYTDVYRPDAKQAPAEGEWAEFTANCSLRDIGSHVCALPTGEHCPRGLVCLGCGHAQPKKSASRSSAACLPATPAHSSKPRPPAERSTVVIGDSHGLVLVL